MRSIALFRPLVAAFLVALPCLLGAGAAQALEKRLALVIGNAAYPAQALATAANDAGLVAQTLQAAGFDVMGARDLDETGLRQAFRDFVEKAEAAGPEAVTFVYLSGYGLQVEGETYFAPVDARINAASDVALTALRVSDYAKRLAALPLKARFLVLDAGRRNPFARQGEPLAGGLALMEAEPGSLVAFNAAPGTVGPDETGSYGAYVKALAEMIRAGGLAPAELFDRVRLRVVETTQGALVPWDSARITAPFEFLARAPDAPPLERPKAALQARPLAEIGARDAFALCLERDTVQGYQDFLGAYPTDPQAARVRAILAARREALTWRQSRLADSPDAYWSYLRRYPRGPHAFDARRRLASLSAALAPPPRFTEIVYDLPPPPADEIIYVERPVVYLADPVYALPPPPPVVFLAQPPAYFVDLAPPPPPVAAYLLPAPAYVPVPTYVAAPVGIAPPPDNPVFGNLHRALAPPAQGPP
ncbi:caspase family protein, partial [Methylobacterium symbioticum]